MKSIISSLLVAFSFLVGSQSLMAGAILNSLLTSSNTLHDADAEFISSGAGNAGGTQLVDGTVLTSIISFNNISNGNLSNANLKVETGMLGYQFTAVSSIQVLSKVDTGTQNAAGQELFDFVFGGVGSTLSNPSSGAAMVSIYEDTNGHFTTGGSSTATDIASAQTGTPIATLGIASGSNNFWVATNVPDDIGAFATVTAQNAPTVYQFGLSVLTNPGNLNVTPNGVTATPVTVLIQPSGSVTYGGNNDDIVGSGQLYGTTGTTTPFQAYSSTDVSFASTAAAPEPSSFILLAFGGVSLVGAALRRRRSLQA